ncbi:hypothetical protein [Streptomyces xantholiticus]|uniref:hypothetical protein n=1 Tax=Streptomyces xantholiticus TaxID=68285 RepID=UPI001673C267|nr:hypothetical protein [Streptomyces xantholiticus]
MDGTADPWSGRLLLGWGFGVVLVGVVLLGVVLGVGEVIPGGPAGGTGRESAGAGASVR